MVKRICEIEMLKVRFTHEEVVVKGHAFLGLKVEPLWELYLNEQPPAHKVVERPEKAT